MIVRGNESGERELKEYLGDNFTIVKDGYINKCYIVTHKKGKLKRLSFGSEINLKDGPVHKEKNKDWSDYKIIKDVPEPTTKLEQLLNEENVDLLEFEEEKEVISAVELHEIKERMKNEELNKKVIEKDNEIADLKETIKNNNQFYFWTLQDTVDLVEFLKEIATVQDYVDVERKTVTFNYLQGKEIKISEDTLVVIEGQKICLYKTLEKYEKLKEGPISYNNILSENTNLRIENEELEEKNEDLSKNLKCKEVEYNIAVEEIEVKLQEIRRIERELEVTQELLRIQLNKCEMPF